MLTGMSVKELLQQDASIIDKEVVVKGWVRNRRDSKAGLSFITVSDGSCFDTLQVVAESKLANYSSQVVNLTKDCSVIITGKIVKSLGGKQNIEVLASIVEVIGMVENPDTYPVSQKRHSVEFLREVAHLRIRTNLLSAVMRVRNTVSYAIHEYFNKNGFCWVHTPIITGSDAEGAGEMFKVTNLDLNALPKNDKGAIDYRQDFFGRETFLTVSGQLNGEAYCLALSKIYTFAPAFRAENSNTTRHLAEFWMVEPEIAFAGMLENADLAEKLLKFVFTAVLNKNADDMRFFADFVDKEAVTRLEHLINNKFVMLSYTEAVKILINSRVKFENPVYWGVDLASEHERWLCEKHIGVPAIITDYPKEIKAFYMRLNDDGKTVAAMDILAPGIGEIIGGSEREERYDVLVKRMGELGMDQNHLSWYLDLRRFGTTPHSGFGLGLERLINYITGVQNIRDVIPFPRASKSANF